MRNLRIFCIQLVTRLLIHLRFVCNSVKMYLSIYLFIHLIFNHYNVIQSKSLTNCDVNNYYSYINPNSYNDDLKQQLKNLTNPHIVIDYDTIWQAFPTIDIYLPQYPCDNNSSHIPDVYSSYCWTPQQNLPTGGECGNYKKEGDCFNREHLWPKSWFGKRL